MTILAIGLVRRITSHLTCVPGVCGVDENLVHEEIFSFLYIGKLVLDFVTAVSRNTNGVDMYLGGDASGTLESGTSKCLS